MSHIPALRLRVVADVPFRRESSFVLYWMTATRRLSWNYALDRAIEIAVETRTPLLILEALSVSYPWASDRHHQAILDGMEEHSSALARSAVGYHAYVEPSPRAGRGLLESLAARAVAVVTDDSPVFFTPDLVEAASRLADVRVEAVDSCGLLPLRAPGRSYGAAYHFRRHLQKELPDHLDGRPSPAPLDGVSLVPFSESLQEIQDRWPDAASAGFFEPDPVRALPIDHSIKPAAWRGGTRWGRMALASFLEDGLPRYDQDRNHPDLSASSGLSPWLHYGHLSAHEVLDAVTSLEGWSPLRLSSIADGRRAGWWGLSESAEAFLDQLVTWRELGFGFAAWEPDYRRYESLPDWARGTLEKHASDPREHTYSLEEFADAETHDELWNAAQRQLVNDGVIHNYLRMLWGKKILEWTSHPREALDIMIELNNRYALDGRDPNSYSGIFWVMGRFDRGWPERAIFGKVRSMTSASTRRKVKLTHYLERWGE